MTSYAVFGGSFNPPHHGHLQVIIYLLNQMKFDHILVVPSKNHPFAKINAPFEKRLSWLKQSIPDFLNEKVSVEPLENEMEGPSYTLLVLQMLKKKYPGTLSLILGDDIKTETEKWHQFDQIEKQFEVIFLTRKNSDIFCDVSSSQIRVWLKNNLEIEKLNQFVAPSILDELRRYFQ